MQGTAEALRNWFATQLYPTVIIFTCLLIFFTIIYVLLRVWSLRVTVAAFIPVAALAFIVAGTFDNPEPIASAFDRIFETAKFAIGAAVAVFLLEISRVLLKNDVELGPAVYVLFLSSAGMFIIYAIMSNFLATTHWLFFGFVIGGGLHIVFRGMPLPRHFGRQSPFTRLIADLRRTIFSKPEPPAA